MTTGQTVLEELRRIRAHEGRALATKNIERLVVEHWPSKKLHDAPVDPKARAWAETGDAVRDLLAAYRGINLVSDAAWSRAIKHCMEAIKAGG